MGQCCGSQSYVGHHYQILSSYDVDRYSKAMMLYWAAYNIQDLFCLRDSMLALPCCCERSYVDRSSNRQGPQLSNVEHLWDQLDSILTVSKHYESGSI